MSDTSQYQGSQAFNQSANANESVTRNTGSLSVSKNLVSLRGVREGLGLDLTLTYSAGATGILGFPSGWGLGLSYIAGTSLSAQGKTNIIDPTWSDTTGYQSGLRYINDHGVFFQTIIPPQPLPSGQPGSFSYKLSNSDGSTDYFDQVGKLIEHDDLFGNYLFYSYTDQFGDIFKNTLLQISDSFGQTVSFGYGPNQIVITTPDGSLTTINIAPGGVQNIVDALNNTTSFLYSSVAGQSVVMQINYPTGLQTQLTYTGLNYIRQDGSSGTFAAVQDHYHLTPTGTMMDHTQYAYGAQSGGNSFTGAASGYVLSSGSDGLMDSNDTQYRYDVLVTRLNNDDTVLAATRIYYNYLHLPMREEHYLVSVAGDITKGFLAEYTYVLGTDQHARSTNYSQPVITDQSVYSTSAQGYVPLRRSTASYDNYGLLITSEEWLYDRSSRNYASQSAISYTYTIASWGGEMPETEMTVDSLTGEQRLISYTLTSDQKSQASAAVSYRPVASSAWIPWKTKSFTYDAAGRVISSALHWTGNPPVGSGSVTTSSVNYRYTYDATAHVFLVAESNAAGDTTTRHYDVTRPGGVMTQVVSPLGATATYQYDALGRVLQQTDPNGHITNTTYAVYGLNQINSAISTGPMGYVVAKTFDPQGRDLTVADNGDSTAPPSPTANRILKQMTYDALGRTTTVTNEIGLVTTSTYDSMSRLISSLDALGNIATTVYDDAAMTKSSYMNGSLRNIRQSDGLGRTVSESQYPDSGDPGATTYHYQETSYSGLGLPQVITSSQKPITGGVGKTLYVSRFTYDVESKTATENYQGFNGPSASVKRTLIRDLFGNTITATKATTYADGRSYSNSATVPAFDTTGRLISLTNALAQTESYTYTADGQLATRKRFDGTVFNYTYDPVGQLLSMQGGGLTQTHTYWPSGRVKSTAKGDATLTFDYTRDGGARSVTFPDGRTQQYHLDKYSRVISETDVSGATTVTSFDNYGRVATKQHAGDTLAAQYGTVNHTTGVQIGDTLTGFATTRRQWTFDGYGNMSASIAYDAKNAAILSANYVRDAAGRLTTLMLSSATSQEPEVNLVRQATYDGINQLIATTTAYKSGLPANSVNFEYDGNFNVLSRIDGTATRHFTYNAIDQIVAPGVAYDVNGRMLADGTGHSFTYNELDQLVSTTLPTNASATLFGYHPDGSLASTSSAADKLAFYYSSGSANVVSSTQGTAAEKMTTFLLDATGRRAAYNGSSAPSYYTSGDASTVLLQQGTDNIAVHYDAYGAMSNSSAIDSDKSFTWNQEYVEPTSGLVYLRSRYYHPTLMRFMTMDSLTAENRYSYCDGDPLNLVDPSGHASTGDILGLVFGSIVGIVATVATGGAAGAAAAAVFGTESLVASVGAATLAGAAGAVAGDATNAGISGQAFTAQRALIDLAAGAAGGAAGGAIGGAAGRTAMASALARGLSQRAITNIGMVCSGFAGGLAGAAASSAVTAAAYDQPFFSSSTALSMAVGAAAGIGGGFLTSGAYLGKLSARIIPVPLSDAEVHLITPVARPADFISPRELLVMAPQAEAMASRAGFQAKPGGETSSQTLDYLAGSQTYDTIAAHGAGNTMFISVEYQQALVAGEPNYVRPMRGDRFASFLRNNANLIGGSGRDAIPVTTPIKLMTCFGAFSNAQTIADALARPVFAGYSEIDRYSFTGWTRFNPR